MSRRNFSQPSLADAFVKAYSRPGGFLEDIAKTFEWRAFDVLMRPLHSSSDGAPAYPPLTMFKIVLLQQWYGLSDPAAEEAVRDRLSFRRFCGVPLDEETPDHSSIWRFRQRLAKLGLDEKLLAEVDRQLDARGLIVKRGTLVDATIIAAAVKPPPHDEGQVNPRDPDASFTKKNGETYFGYKAHLAVDEESGIVRQAEMTSADLHDSQRGEAMIQGDEQAYYGDKAYDSAALRKALNDKNIDDKIAYKAKRGARQPDWQRWFNKTASSVRVGVERANATMKNWYGMARVRYRSLARNNCHLQFVAMAMNMKRARVLDAAA
ncbi:MAG: IS5 family transposase [Methylocystis sp.]